MSDLSRLLGDVYGTSAEAEAGSPAPGPAETGAQGPAGGAGASLPDWADDGVLDEAFARWVPGPPAEAPAAERSMLTDLAADAPAAGPAEPGVPAPATVEDELLVPQSGWLFDANTSVATTSLESLPRDGVLAASDDDLPYVTEEAVALVESATAARWRREDDDLLPGRRSSRRGR